MNNKPNKNKPKKNKQGKKTKKEKREKENKEKVHLINCTIGALSQIAKNLVFHPDEFATHFKDATEYVAIIPSTIPGSNDETIMVIRRETLDEAIEDVESFFSELFYLTDVYYYCPDTKLILFFTEREFYVIDYNNYDNDSPFDTTISIHTGEGGHLDTRNMMLDKTLIENVMTQSISRFNEVKKAKETHICSYCKVKSYKQIFRCSKCRAVYYCNADCQKQDWPHHKPNCFSK